MFLLTEFNLLQIALGKPVQVGSYAVVNHTKLTTMSAEILTNVTSLDYDSKSSPDVIPLWIVVTSACLGALILMALIYLLYRVCIFSCFLINVVILNLVFDHYVCFIENIQPSKSHELKKFPNTVLQDRLQDCYRVQGVHAKFTRI